MDNQQSASSTVAIVCELTRSSQVRYEPSYSRYSLGQSPITACRTSRLLDAPNASMPGDKAISGFHRATRCRLKKGSHGHLSSRRQVSLSREPIDGRRSRFFLMIVRCDSAHWWLQCHAWHMCRSVFGSDDKPPTSHEPFYRLILRRAFWISLQSSVVYTFTRA